MPALFTRPCRPPNVAAAPTADSQSRSAVTSCRRKVAAAPSSPASRRPSGSSTSPMTIRAPSLTNRRASAAPCPRAPPLISMTLPFRRSILPSARSSGARSVPRRRRKRRELQLVRPARPVLGVEVIERLGDLYRVDQQIGPVLQPRQGPGSRRVDGAVDHHVGDVDAVLRVLLGQHLRQGAHHHPGVVERLSG